MQDGTAGIHSADEKPLLSARLILGALVGIGLLATASLAISSYGRLYGAQLALAGHSDSTHVFKIAIGRDLLHLPANTIRFEPQRRDGIAEQVDLQLQWPSMEGYSRARRMDFDDISQAQSLLFLQISQSTMSRDMSGRVEPIYRHLMTASSEPGPAGLIVRHFKPGTGFEGEIMLSAPDAVNPSYAIRCLAPTQGEAATSSDCQRDIHVGEDLSVLYRFSSRLLPDWKRIDDAVRAYVQQRAGALHPDDKPKKPSEASIDRSS